MNSHNIVLATSMFVCGMLYAGDASTTREANQGVSHTPTSVAAVSVLVTKVPASSTIIAGRRSPKRSSNRRPAGMHPYAHLSAEDSMKPLPPYWGTIYN